MKKVMMMLLLIAATITAHAQTLTAKAKITLTSTSGYSCELMLSEYASAGALNGSVMNMDDRVVALYVLNGTTKLQIANAADFSDVPVGLITDASTTYSLDVSLVDGQTLYLYDLLEEEGYALTEGAHYSITADASATIEDRFYLTKVLPEPTKLETCFNGTVLYITNNPIYGKITVTRKKDSTTREYARTTSQINLSAYSNGEVFNIQFGTGAKKRSFNVTVKK